MKKIFLCLSLGVLVLSGLGFAIANKQVDKSIEADAIGNYSTNASTYYNNITATSGKQLAAQLHDLITSSHGYYTSYADNGANLYQQNTDQYYEGNTKVTGYLYEFYSGVKWPNAWTPTAGNTSGGYNREHCWCQSNSVNKNGTQMWGETGGGADMHHLRPVEVRLNSTRNNHVYGEVGSGRDSHKVYAKYGDNATYAHGGYYYNDVFEPLDSKKGDVARIILYTYLHYNSYTISDIFGSYGTTNGSGSSSFFSTSLLSLTKTTNQSTEAKALEMLLEWNASDPVDAIEQRRNEQVAIYQGNRNPFIDNSNYAEMIWGTGSATPTVNSVTVSPSSLALDLNGTTTGNLTATVSVSNGAAQTVNWTSSNANVATVNSSGVVTAHGKGSCLITATSTVNSNKSASCSVTVANSSSGGGGGSTPSTDYELYSGSLTEGNYVIYYSGKAMKNTVSSNRLGYLEVTPSNDIISNPDSSIVWHIAPSGNYWTIYNESVVQYAAGNGTKNQATLNSSGSDNSSLWTVSGTSTYEFVNKENSSSSVNANLRNNGTYGFACYATSTGGALSLYKQGTSSGQTATLSSITLNTSNVQTSFEIGDEFDYTGLEVTAHYSDDTEDVVTPTSVSSPDMSTAGEKTITVTYTESAVQKTATYTITVTAAATSEHGRQPDDPLSVTEAIAVCTETGTTQTEEHYYTQGIVSKITGAFNSDYGNISFTISADGTTSGDQLTVYRCKYLNGAKFTSADQLTVGMEVIIVGYLVNYNSTTPEYVANSYVYEYVENPTPSVISVTVSPSTLTLQLDGTSSDTLTATVIVSGGAAQTVNWTSSNTSVATVNSSGKVTAVAAGEAIITATSTVDNTKTGTCTVTVKESVSSNVHTFVRITDISDLTDGVYAIVYSSNAFDGSLTTLDANNNKQSIELDANSKFDLDADYCFTITKVNSNYTIKSASGYYIGATSDSNSLNSSTSTAYTNTISFDDGAVNIVGSGGAYLRYNTSASRFRYYKSSSYTSQAAIALYKMEDAVFAEKFIDTVTCNSQGTSAPTYKNSSSWSDLSTYYTNNLSSTTKNLFKSASANESGTTLEKAVAKYDYIVRKYHYTNFMSRTGLSSNNPVVVTNNNTSLIVVVLSMSCISLLAVSIFFIKSKKKEF